MNVNRIYTSNNCAAENINRNRETKAEQGKIQSQNKDSFKKMTEDEKRYLDHLDSYQRYIQAILAATAVKTKPPVTPAEEMFTEENTEFPSPIEECGDSNPTHNEQSHSYNQEQEKEPEQTEESIYPDFNN